MGHASRRRTDWGKAAHPFDVAQGELGAATMSTCTYWLATMRETSASCAWTGQEAMMFPAEGGILLVPLVAGRVGLPITGRRCTPLAPALPR